MPLRERKSWRNDEAKNKRATILTSSLSIVDWKETPSLYICRAPSCSSRGMQDATLPFLVSGWGSGRSGTSSTRRCYRDRHAFSHTAPSVSEETVPTFPLLCIMNSAGTSKHWVAR